MPRQRSFPPTHYNTQVFIEQNPTASIFYSGSLFKDFKALAQEVFAILDFLPENRVWDSSLDSLKVFCNI